MPGALLDTNAISDLMRGDKKLKARVDAYTGTLWTSVIVLGEFRYGIERLPVGKKRSELEAKAKSMLPSFLAEPITVDIAEEYARTRTNLEASGLNLDDNDLWIACTAIVCGHQLVTRDSLLFRIPGLTVEDWTV